MLTKLILAFNKSKSLVAIHLCGNPGVTEEFKSFAIEEMNIEVI